MEIVLLHPERTVAPRTICMWRPTAIGMMINNVVPARAGELARAFALSRSTSAVPFPAAFASLAVDRLFDAVVVLLLTFGLGFAAGCFWMAWR